MAAEKRENEQKPGLALDPIGVSPASGLDNANFSGKYNSQLAKQQMLMGNFSPSQMWAHVGHGPPKKPVRSMSAKKRDGSALSRKEKSAGRQDPSSMAGLMPQLPDEKKSQEL